MAKSHGTNTNSGEKAEQQDLSLILGGQGGTDTVEGSVTVSHQPKHAFAIQPGNNISGSSPT